MGHRLVFGDMQKMHDGPLHCGVYPGTTVSPTATEVTPSPMASTMAPASWPRIEGNKPSGSWPLSVYTSVWQSALHTTFTRTCRDESA